MTTRLFFLSLAFLSLLTPSPAQETKPDKPKALFRVLALNDVPEGMVYKLDEKNVAISTPLDFRSPFYDTPASGSLVFYSPEKRPDGSTELKQQATITIPPGILFGLVLLDKTNEGVSARIFDDGPEAFPGGSYRMINVLPSDASVVLAKENHQLPPGGEKLVKPNPAGVGRTLFIQIYQVLTGNRRLLFSNNWAFNETSRTLVVICPAPPPSENPTVRRIAEPVSIFDSQKSPLLPPTP